MAQTLANQNAAVYTDGMQVYQGPVPERWRRTRMYKRGPQGLLKHLDFIILDVICLQVSYLFAYILRQGMCNPYSNQLYRNTVLIMILMDVVVSVFWETLKNVLKRGYYKEFASTCKHVFLVIVLTAFYLFLIYRGSDYSRIVLLATGAIYLLLSYAARILWKMRLRCRMSGIGYRSLMIVTTFSMMEQVITNIRNHDYEMFRIVGVAVIDKDWIGHKFDEISVVASRETVLDYVCREWVDEVFIDIPDTEPYPGELIGKFSEMGVAAHMKLARSGDLPGKKQFVERLGNYTVLTTSINCATSGQLFLKRALDILGGLAGCMITLFLVLIIGPMIYIQSPGPIFFSQVRVGKNGKKFKMYKFRSMYMDAEERKKELMAQNRVADGMMFKLDWDPRIIGSKKLSNGTMKKGIGNYIRDWSLDEFPQFFNVLKGDMSLVGTRPPTVDEWEKYDLHHRARLAIRPGVTGMWQVSGRSNITDFENVVKLDTAYISEWSMGLDIKILLMTVKTVFEKDGAL